MNAQARVIKNIASLAAAEVLIQGLSLAPAIYISRVLGVTQYGKYILALTFAGLFAALSDMALRPVIVREVARSPEQAGKIALNALALKLVSAAFALFLTVAAAAAVGYAQDTTIYIGFVAVMIALDALSDAFQALFQGLERMEYDALTRSLEKLLAVALGLFLLTQGYGVWGVIVALPVSALVTLAVSYALARRRFVRLSLHMNDAPLRGRLFRAAVPLWGANMLATAQLRIDTIILSVLAGEETVGLYGAAYTVVAMLRLLPLLINRSVYPILSRAGIGDRQALLDLTRRLLRYTLLLALPLTVGAAILSDRIISLVYGAGFVASGPILQWLCCTLPVTFVAALYGNVMIAIDQQRLCAVATAASALTGIGLDLALIPRWGMVGAAAAAIFAESAGLCAYSYYIRKHVGAVGLHRLLIRPGLAALMMGCVVLAMGRTSLLAVIPAGVAVYAICALVLGAFSPGDWYFLRQAVLPTGNPQK